MSDPTVPDGLAAVKPECRRDPTTGARRCFVAAFVLSAAHFVGTLLAWW